MSPKEYCSLKSLTGIIFGVRNCYEMMEIQFLLVQGTLRKNHLFLNLTGFFLVSIFQESENGTWHFPMRDADDISRRSKWQCVTRSNKSINKDQFEA